MEMHGIKRPATVDGDIEPAKFVLKKYRGKVDGKNDDDYGEYSSPRRRVLSSWPSSHHSPLSSSSRIFRVTRSSGGKDRHSKVLTAKGLRDRRVRLSVSTAIQFYDLQDRLGYDQPSKAVEWLIHAASPAIAELPSLDTPFAELIMNLQANGDRNPIVRAKKPARKIVGTEHSKWGVSSTSENSKEKEKHSAMKDDYFGQSGIFQLSENSPYANSSFSCFTGGAPAGELLGAQYLVGDHDLNFSISPSFSSCHSRGTLQSNYNPTQLPLQPQRLVSSQEDGLNPPPFFLFTSSTTETSMELSQAGLDDRLQLCFGDGSSTHFDFKDKAL